MKKRITQDDYIKANRKASREAEIEMYGHPICHKRVHQSKKVYNRKKIKAANKELPYFLSFSKGITYTTLVNSPVVESIINP
ncbi:hypothetical protein [Bacteroides sp. GM023]|uniref:hypothetical protein n=1 Tax=Bacteroides sp. GM023 TaxID=2723058 RepID=UPI00168BE050|nr:hypothetical protein [Bacteroides sp. GM023]MBD3587900.1 hypothetical protein [Bacteroides sp. GM023]